MNENEQILLEKAFFLRIGFEHTIQAIIVNEKPAIDPFVALDELALLLTTYTKSLKAAP